MGCVNSTHDHDGTLYKEKFNAELIDSHGEGHSKCVLQLSENEIILTWLSSRKQHKSRNHNNNSAKVSDDKIVWPLRFIRRYGFDAGYFSLEAGTRCHPNTGVYTFRLKNAEIFFHRLQETVNHLIEESQVSHPTFTSSQSLRRQVPQSQRNRSHVDHSVEANQNIANHRNEDLETSKDGLNYVNESAILASNQNCSCTCNCNKTLLNSIPLVDNHCCNLSHEYTNTLPTSSPANTISTFPETTRTATQDDDLPFGANDKTASKNNFLFLPLLSPENPPSSTKATSTTNYINLPSDSIAQHSSLCTTENCIPEEELGTIDLKINTQNDRDHNFCYCHFLNQEVTLPEARQSSISSTPESLKKDYRRKFSAQSELISKNSNNFVIDPTGDSMKSSADSSQILLLPSSATIDEQCHNHQFNHLHHHPFIRHNLSLKNHNSSPRKGSLKKIDGSNNDDDDDDGTPSLNYVEVDASLSGSVTTGGTNTATNNSSLDSSNNRIISHNGSLTNKFKNSTRIINPMTSSTIAIGSHSLSAVPLPRSASLNRAPVNNDNTEISYTTVDFERTSAFNSVKSAVEAKHAEEKAALLAKSEQLANIGNSTKKSKKLSLSNKH